MPGNEVQSVISGTIGAASFTDEDIIANSLSVTMSTCSKGNFTFGTFNAAVLKMSLRYSGAAPDGARIVLQKNSTPLGTYWVDDSKTKRRGGILHVVAVDAASLFDIEIPSSIRQQTYTAGTALTAACTAAGVTFGGIGSGLPNQNVTLALTSASVQTYRDLVMWVAQLCAGNAVINRNGSLEIRPAMYGVGDSSSYSSDASNRSDIEFADTRTWVKYMSAYSGRRVKMYQAVSDPESSEARPGSIALPLNPLLDGKTETECDTINCAIRDAVGSLVRDITAKCVDDPSVSLGDMANFTGGRTHSRAGGALGVVTGITWRFRGVTTVTCTAPTSVKEV